MVDVPLPHLDRPFDYLVPAELDEAIAAGSRVRVRFAGRLVDGCVLERADGHEHSRHAGVPRAGGRRRAGAERRDGRAVPRGRRPVGGQLRRRRAAGRATPARARRVGRRARPAQRPDPPVVQAAQGWARYRAGASFSPRSRRDGRPARSGRRCPARLGRRDCRGGAGGAGRRAGPSWSCPTPATSTGWTPRSPSVLGPGRHVALSADLGPAERYRRWLAVRRGRVRVVIGTRAAAFAPVRRSRAGRDLGRRRRPARRAARPVSARP